MMNLNDFETTLNGYNVNIELPMPKAMRLMSLLILFRLEFEEQQVEMSKDTLLKDDLNELNELIDICKFVMKAIDKSINDSIGLITKREQEERFKSMLADIKSALGGK